MPEITFLYRIEDDAASKPTEVTLERAVPTMVVLVSSGLIANCGVTVFAILLTSFNKEKDIALSSKARENSVPSLMFWAKST